MESNVSKELKTRFFIAIVESVLLYGCESWTFSSALEILLDGCYTRMLRVVLNISWQSFARNEELYGTRPRIFDKAAWRRLGLAGHCFKRQELLAGELVLWEPSHGHRGRGRPSATIVDTLNPIPPGLFEGGAAWGGGGGGKCPRPITLKLLMMMK